MTKASGWQTGISNRYLFLPCFDEFMVFVKPWLGTILYSTGVLQYREFRYLISKLQYPHLGIEWVIKWESLGLCPQLLRHNFIMTQEDAEDVNDCGIKLFWDEALWSMIPKIIEQLQATRNTLCTGRSMIPGVWKSERAFPSLLFLSVLFLTIPYQVTVFQRTKIQAKSMRYSSRSSSLIQKALFIANQMSTIDLEYGPHSIASKRWTSSSASYRVRRMWLTLVAAGVWRIVQMHYR